MAFYSALRKHCVIRGYLRKLPKLLTKDYGFSQSYAPRQVRNTIERYKMNRDYSCYAISMFSDRASFDQYHHDLGERCDYDAMRAEVAMSHFNGDSNVTTSDIMEEFRSSPHMGVGGDHHGVEDGHSHGGGDGGHGH